MDNVIRLREIREKKRITQKQLSELSGISQSSISEFEKGKHECTTTSICKLCRALSVTPNDFIKEEYWK